MLHFYDQNCSVVSGVSACVSLDCCGRGSRLKNRTNRQYMGPLRQFQEKCQAVFRRELRTRASPWFEENAIALTVRQSFCFRPLSPPTRIWRAFCRVPNSGQGRWTSYLEKSPAGSIQKANMSFVDEKAITSGVPASGIKAPGIGSYRHQWFAESRRTRRQMKIASTARKTGPHRLNKQKGSAQGLQRRLDPAAFQHADPADPWRRGRDGICQAEDCR